MIYQIIWFALIGILLAVYAVLDGFDLGVGFWQLFSGKDERKNMLDSIKPFWDGNEVWLLVGGGALFAAFPAAYATVFSGFYLAVMLLVFSLILRAVSFEFRDMASSPKFAAAWDIAFFVSSVIPPVIFGVALANIVKGVPLNLNGDYTGTFFGLLTPYPLAMGIMSLVMFAFHGAVYTAMKSDGVFRTSALKRAKTTWLVYLVMFFVVTVFGVVIYPNISVNYWVNPILLLIPLLALGCIIAVRVLLSRSRMISAFIMSSATIVMLMATYAAGLFPYLVYSLGGEGASLKIFNSSSSEKTLLTMLIIALIGMPFVVVYNVYIYRMFRKANIKPE
jgi:cytochrome bd ubiquinol oxidase subunit II